MYEISGKKNHMLLFFQEKSSQRLTAILSLAFSFSF